MDKEYFIRSMIRFLNQLDVERVYPHSIWDSIIILDWGLSVEGFEYWKSFKAKYKRSLGTNRQITMGDLVDTTIKYLEMDKQTAESLKKMIFGEPADRYMGTQIIISLFKSKYYGSQS